MLFNMNMQYLVGNTFEESAYHEAGHVVAAAALGLALRSKGITILEAANGATAGEASYWEDDREPEKTLSGNSDPEKAGT